MAISKEFLNLFEKFVTHYKQTGAPSFYSWTRESNYSSICDFLEDLFSLIQLNQETIHDTSVIENLSTTILLTAKTNPFLVSCWMNFLETYNTSAKHYAPLGTLKMNIGLTGAPSENLIRDLKDALTAQKSASDSIQKIHHAEIEQLKKQVMDLQTEKSQLIAQNDQLKTQVSDRKTLEQTHTQIITAQAQLQSIALLLGVLHETTKKVPVTEAVSSQNTRWTRLIDKASNPEQQPQEIPPQVADNEEYREDSDHPEESSCESFENASPLSKEIPPAPPFPIQPVRAPKSFFQPSNNDQLLVSITEALEKMKQKKQEAQVEPDTLDKKKLPK